MNDVLMIGDPPITVHLRKNTRAKRYSLRISNKDGKVSLTLPRWSKMSEAEEFARTQEGWMRKHLSRQLKPIPVEFGGRILLDGEKLTISHGAGRTVQVGEGQLLVPGSPAQLAGKLRAFYKTLARERLVTASEHYAGLIGRSIGTVTLRDTRSRWGSCTSDGNLMYSWRLVMAPRHVQDYVAAHEVCHLIEMNHSNAYWALVAGISPNYKSDRQWLKVNGALLHQYQL
jgi:predicted metal-dependent hydrolase